MHRFALPALILLTACAEGGVTLYNPLTGAAVTTVDPRGYAERRAAVEVAVKSRFDAVLADIAAGGGPDLTRAMDAAAVPSDERPARRTQLRGDLELYRGNPDALINQLLLYGA